MRSHVGARLVAGGPRGARHGEPWLTHIIKHPFGDKLCLGLLYKSHEGMKKNESLAHHTDFNLYKPVEDLV